MADMVMDQIVTTKVVILTSQITEQNFIICISDMNGNDLGTITLDHHETAMLLQLNNAQQLQ